ncbi:tRNA dihydrouridine(20/20a) synthase DusA [Fodinicurvata sp. EGI_FJ10296]|uniref:tRNA dihydrouridine(20/20a) synthase DusA n=1 Tax=Fodinicurvata sp. EGI_FJ10296 TaxID=3231908 RepID=UPI003452DB07
MQANAATRAARFSIAPMMDWTTRHCRRFHRSLTGCALLYTEMVTSAAVIHGDRDRLLGFDAAQNPIALQLGGSDAVEMAAAAEIGGAYGYDEININVGCPSDRVQNGRFGACLMAEPETVAACVAAMRAAVDIPVTVKTRIGIDDQDSYADLRRFVDIVAGAGCDTFIVHARKAWLNGLSPKENREVPPLDYERVFQLKSDYPELTVVLNGGLTTIADSQAALERVDGVMLGRAAYQSPYLLAAVDKEIFGLAKPVAPRTEIVDSMVDYCRAQVAAGVPLHAVTRHMLGLFQGQPGARHWRRVLSEGARVHTGDPADLFAQAQEGIVMDRAA